MDKNIKLLLILINAKGTHLNLETITKYSPENNNIYNKYFLVFWHNGLRINKKTNQEEEYWYSDKYEFNSKVQVIKYLLQVKENLDE